MTVKPIKWTGLHIEGGQRSALKAEWTNFYGYFLATGHLLPYKVARLPAMLDVSWELHGMTKRLGSKLLGKRQITFSILDVWNVLNSTELQGVWLCCWYSSIICKGVKLISYKQKVRMHIFIEVFYINLIFGLAYCSFFDLDKWVGWINVWVFWSASIQQCL